MYPFPFYFALFPTPFRGKVAAEIASKLSKTQGGIDRVHPKGQEVDAPSSDALAPSSTARSP